jgi:hypothetical protein
MRKPLNVIANFHWIVPGEAARSAQPLALTWKRLLTANGIETIVNLRGPNPRFSWWRNEREVCAALGIQHLDVTLDSRKLPTRTMLAGLFDAFDAARKPLLVKCSGGQDRSSLAAALYLIQRDGWPAYDRAMAQFARWPYLHFPKAQQRWLRPFLQFAKAEAGKRPVAEWAREHYSPEGLAAWLDGQGQRHFYREIFTKAEASRWQW